MEQIIQKLLVTDNEVILKGTEELREALKKPDGIPNLCAVLQNSVSAEVRQYAAVLLRKKFTKSREWNKVQPEIRQMIKEGILQILVAEQVNNVKNSVGLLVGTIAKHEVPTGQWPAFFEFLVNTIDNEDPAASELGMYTLKIVSEVVAEQFCPYFEVIFKFVSKMLKRTGSLHSYYAVVTMIHISPYLRKAELRQFEQLLALVVDAIRAFQQIDEDKACEMFDIFEIFLNFEQAIILAHVQEMLSFCFEMASNANIADSVKVNAIDFVSSFVKACKKTVIKMQLVEPIISNIFPIISSPVPADEDEDYDDDEEDDSTTPVHTSLQVLDTMALCLPPEKFLPILLKYVETSLASNNPYAKKAALMSLGVVAEGCSEYIRQKCMKEFLQYIGNSILDDNMVVKNSGLFALGQFSEHLQPEISAYSDQVLPVLLQGLSQLLAEIVQNRLQSGVAKEPKGMSRLFYALEMFCENLGEKLTPHLPSLMEKFFVALDASNTVHVREMGISAIGSAASATKEGIVPFFPVVMEHLKPYLSDQPEETLSLQVQSLYTVAILAKTINDPTWARECITLAHEIVEQKDSPELRKAAYGLFAASCHVLKENVVEYLPRMIQHMLDSVQSTQGVVTDVHDEAVVALATNVLDDDDEEENLDDTSDSEDEDDGYNVENVFLEEKEEACFCLKEIAASTGSSFWPYVQKVYDELFNMLDFVDEDIRRTAIDATVEFLISVKDSNIPELQEFIQKSMFAYISKISVIVHMDDIQQVVVAALEALARIVGAYKQIVTEPTILDAVVETMKDVLSNKTVCQEENDDTEDDDNLDAEQDEMLLQYAEDILPNLGKAMQPTEFSSIFASMLPILEKRLKKHDSVSEKSSIIGTIADCLKSLGPHLLAYSDQILQAFIYYSKDSAPDVRNNAVYGMGELAMHGGELLFKYHPAILQQFSSVMLNEDSPLVIDNICAAVAKIIVTNSQSPIETLFPVLLRNLPLKEDKEENLAIFRCFVHLYQIGHPVLRDNLHPLVTIAASVLANDDPTDEVKELIVSFVKSISHDFTQEFHNMLNTMEASLAQRLKELF